MTEEIYITIGSRSDKFAKRNVGQTTRWPIKEGAPKGARVYFLIGTELVAKGVIATEDVIHANFWGGAEAMARHPRNPDAERVRFAKRASRADF